MLKRSLILAVTILIGLPGITAGQGLGLAARVGTLGLGGEVALGVTDRAVLRGGVGFTPIDVGLDFGDLDVDVSFPTVYNVGVDLYLNGAFRIGGGVLFRSGDVEATGEFQADQDIGGTVYTPQEIGTLRGVLEAKGKAPYVLIGFGRHTALGVGLSIDLGVAFVGDPDITLSGDGTLSGDPSFGASLQQEAAEWEDDTRGYLKFWPIFSLGLRLGAN